VEGSSCGLIKVLSQHWPGESEENHENPVRIVGVLVEIQTCQASDD
jgi:hypothetical protein